MNLLGMIEFVVFVFKRYPSVCLTRDFEESGEKGREYQNKLEWKGRGRGRKEN